MENGKALKALVVKQVMNTNLRGETKPSGLWEPEEAEDTNVFQDVFGFEKGTRDGIREHMVEFANEGRVVLFRGIDV